MTRAMRYNGRMASEGRMSMEADGWSLSKVAEAFQGARPDDLRATIEAPEVPLAVRETAVQEMFKRCGAELGVAHYN